ncbi:MAG TPA: hypothetical protein VF791_03370 [Pyrinomonadaceae bacterium]
MKQLLFIITLAALLASCSKSAPPPFRGQLRELIPQQVGDFKLTGEIKPLDIAQGERPSGALRPTEGATARYETPMGSQLNLQVVNYLSAADAEQALKQMDENIRDLKNGAKVTEGTRTGGAGGAAGRKIVVEGLAPGVHSVMWVGNSSVLYLASGADLKVILEFEQKLP